MGMGRWFRDNFSALPKDNLHELVWWDEKILPGTKVKIAMTPSHHWGRRTAFDENVALWGSWSIIGPKHKYVLIQMVDFMSERMNCIAFRFWFGGDTAYSDVFKQIGRKYGPFHISAIPIGAYEPRNIMKDSHVNPEEAVKIHQDIKSQKSLGIHWGTFKLTYEHYLEPKSRTKDAAQDARLNITEFMVVNVGDTIYG